MSGTSDAVPIELCLYVVEIAVSGTSDVVPIKLCLHVILFLL